MKIIEYLSQEIEDELKGAECYIKKAIKIKDEYPDVAQALYSISLEEMEHVDKLHTQVTKLIKEYREEKGEPPASMMAVYNYMHERQIGQAAAIKNLQDLYIK